MEKDGRNDHPASANAAVALGLLTVGFAAGIYTPPAGAQGGPYGDMYWNDEGTMGICVCDAGNFCAPCWPAS